MYIYRERERRIKNQFQFQSNEKMTYTEREISEQFAKNPDKQNPHGKKTLSFFQ